MTKKVTKDELVARAVELGLGGPAYLKQKIKMSKLKKMITDKEKELAEESTPSEEVVIEIDENTPTEDVETNVEETSEEKDTFVEDETTPVNIPEKKSERDPRCLKCKYRKTYGKGICKSCTLYIKK